MSEDFLKRHLGLDWFDLVVHVGLTVCGIGFLAISNAPEELYPVATGASLGLLGLRRHLARKKRVLAGVTSGEMAAVRLEELEQRLGELEASQTRIAELEERLDFAERLLARQSPDRKLLEEGQAR
jgi:hypothetical protein